MALVDLHLHSRFSDGTYGPEELAAQARRTFTETGNNGNLLRTHNSLQTLKGIFTETALNSYLFISHKLSISTGSYIETGFATTLIYSAGAKIIYASAGTFTLTGNLVKFKIGIFASQASYSIVGYNSNLIISRKLSSNYGIFILTGNTVEFNIDFSAPEAHYSIIGYNSNLVISRKLLSNNGVFNLTGNIVEFQLGFETGAAVFLLVGNPVIMSKSRVISAFGNYSLILNDCPINKR